MSLHQRIVQNACKAASTRLPSAAALRPFSSTTRTQVWKDKQDKDSIRVEWQENTKSATDERSAELEETAFSRDKTTPEEQLESASGESKRRAQSMSNPLEASPANQEISKSATHRPEHEDQIEKGLPRQASATGSSKKGAKAKQYEPDSAQRIPGTEHVG